MQSFPINIAETIIEPFWDMQLSGLDKWKIRDGKAHGLRVYQNWCWVGFEWARRPSSGPALHMSRTFDVDCSMYDNLVVSIMAPESSVLHVEVETDKGNRVFRSEPAGQFKREHAVPLRGAKRIRRVTLSLEARQDGIAGGWLNWIGLQNVRELKRHIALWNRFDTDWDKYLKPTSFKPSFKPVYGLIAAAAEIERMRREHRKHLARFGTSPFVEAARKARKIVPETRIRDFVNFWNDTRYCRERDHGNELLRLGPAAAIAGLLTRDAGLLRLAARYAMSLGMCGDWDDGMICRMPGSPFDHRCFVQSLCTWEISLIMDLAGEWFTDLGREYLMRRIAEEGLGAIQHNAWKYEYIFHCNQLAWFTPGRMLGSCLLEHHWPRVKAHTEQAYKDLVESLNDTVLPDGGYVEGPTYFTCVAHHGGLPLYVYARRSHKPFSSVVPASMRRAAAFGETIASTDEKQDAIPICDGRPMLDQNTLAVMAAVLPLSAWARMFRRAVARTKGLPDTLLALQLEKSIPSKATPPVPFVRMPVMGPVASTRKLRGDWVKLFIMGNKAGAGHTHEDKGSFVLEFAGDTFAMDPGTCDYSHPLAGIVHNCERHNMLVPYGTPERPHPVCPLPHDIHPGGHGNARSFSAKVDLTPGWENYYRHWSRAWDSPSPDRLVIRDRYALRKGDGVEFCWSTRLPVIVKQGMVHIRGKRGLVVIEPPTGAAVRVDKLKLLDGAQHRIVFRVAGRKGSLTTRVTLQKT